MPQCGQPIVWVEGGKFDEERCSYSFTNLDECLCVVYTGTRTAEPIKGVLFLYEQIDIDALGVDVVTSATCSDAAYDRANTQFIPYPFTSRRQQWQQRLGYMSISQ